uniref:Uncharacterized protein n=1 Tax=Rhizophora mucronata TaxID=61149 RepID=A0A2P2N370_RHIMU
MKRDEFGGLNYKQTSKDNAAK